VVTQFYSSSEIYVYYFPKTTSKNGIGLIFNSELGKTIDGIKNKAKVFIHRNKGSHFK
jgi:hypothetical protein